MQVLKLKSRSTRHTRTLIQEIQGMRLPWVVCLYWFIRLILQYICVFMVLITVFGSDKYGASNHYFVFCVLLMSHWTEWIPFPSMLWCCWLRYMKVFRCMKHLFVLSPEIVSQAEPIIQKRNKTEQVCKLSWVLEHISVIIVTYHLRVYLGMLAFKVQLCAALQ